MALKYQVPAQVHAGRANQPKASPLYFELPGDQVLSMTEPRTGGPQIAPSALIPVADQIECFAE